MVILTESVIRALDEATLDTIWSAMVNTDTPANSAYARRIEAENCKRLLSRYDRISRYRAGEDGLTKDCVRQMRDEDGNTWNFHLRTGLCWSAMP